MRQDKDITTHRQQKTRQRETSIKIKASGKTMATTQRQGEHKTDKDKELDESNNANDLSMTTAKKLKLKKSS